MAITIRAGTVDDTRAVAQLRYRMDTEGGGPAGSGNDFATAFERWLDRQGAWRWFVAEDDGRLIGMLWLVTVSWRR